MSLRTKTKKKIIKTQLCKFGIIDREIVYETQENRNGNITNMMIISIKVTK